MRWGLSDYARQYFAEQYGQNAAQLDCKKIFYYIYALLHSPDYRSRYANNLAKELPRIPAKSPKNYQEFCHYSKLGRQLAALHSEYDKGLDDIAAAAAMSAEITALGLRFYHQKETLSLDQLWRQLGTKPAGWRVEKM